MEENSYFETSMFQTSPNRCDLIPRMSKPKAFKEPKGVDVKFGEHINVPLADRKNKLIGTIFHKLLFY